MTPLDASEQHALDLARSGEAMLCHYAGTGGCDCVCDVVIVPAPRGGRIVLFSERADNHGTSITNWFEELATQIYREHLRDTAPAAIRWMERYPARPGVEETLDRVVLMWDGCVFNHPVWQYVAAAG